jgi:hypothetical protein
MPSVLTKSILKNNQSNFSNNFEIVKYDNEITNAPILNIWKDINLKINQNEKYNAFLFLYHEVKNKDTLESISQSYYDTTSYWWLILLINEVSDPFDFLREKLNSDSSAIKILKPQHLNKILNTTNSFDFLNYIGYNNNNE